jgi:hypothetical protein
VLECAHLQADSLIWRNKKARFWQRADFLDASGRFRPKVEHRSRALPTVLVVEAFTPRAHPIAHDWGRFNSAGEIFIIL